MQDKMTYMVVIKPDGRALVTVLDRGVVECEKAEDIAKVLGEVETSEVLPDTAERFDTHLNLGDDE